MKRKTKLTLKEFWDENKAEIVLGTALTVIAGAAFGVVLRDRKIHMEAAKGQKILDAFESTHRFVDEDIFTDLAPQIEDLVLTEGVDEGLIEKVYKVSYPLAGDPKNGFYDVKKYVKVLVQDAGDFE